jgi:hypothetical protein
MPIISISETVNVNIPASKPIKEAMDIYIKGVPEGLSRRNGMIYTLCGSGGSGKTNLLMNLFTQKEMYKQKFENIYYFCPETSFKSIAKHPFEKHDKVYHDLDIPTLTEIVSELEAKKRDAEANDEPLEYSCVVIDDYASSLKDKALVIFLNKTLTRARHLQCSFIFTLQSFNYFPLILRKQITFTSIFKPKNKKEFETLTNELIQLNPADALILSNYIFDAPYNHLDIDTFENKMYKNFNILELNER